MKTCNTLPGAGQGGTAGQARREALLDQLTDALEHAGEGPEALAALHRCLDALEAAGMPERSAVQALERFREKYGLPD